MRPELQAFQELLARNGYRVTPQRLGIYEYLLGTTGHPCAEEIYQALQGHFPMMSQATVYKTLELLVQLGLISELAFGGEPNRYDGNPKVHINVRCTRCHHIYDLEDPELERLALSVEARSGFQLLGQRHEYYGLCPRCRTGQTIEEEPTAGGH